MSQPERSPSNSRPNTDRSLHFSFWPSSISGYIVVTYLLLMLLTVLVVWSVQFQAQRLMREAAQTLSVVFEEYRLARELHLWVTESESTLVDYLITGDSDALAEYELARDQFRQLLAEATAQSGLSAETRSSLQRIDELGKRWFDEIAEPAVSAYREQRGTPSNVDGEHFAGEVINSAAPVLKALREETFLLTSRTQQQLEAREAALAQNQARFGTLSLWLSLIWLIVVTITGWRLIHAITHPIARLTAAARQGSDGSFQPVQLPNAPRELTALAEAFNRMVGSLDQNEQTLLALNRQLERRLRELNALLEISRSVTSSLDFYEVLRRILRESVKAFPGARKAIVHLVDETENFLVPVALSAESQPVRSKHGMPVGQGIAGRAVRERRSFCIPDTSQEPAYLDLGTEVHALLVAPLTIGDRVIGALSIDSDQRGAFTPDQVPILESLASQMAVAIENARLFDESQTRIRELIALYHSALKLASSHTVGAIQQLIVQEAMRLVPCKAGALLLRTSDGFSVVYARGLSLAVETPGPVLENELLSKVLETRQSLHTSGIISWTFADQVVTLPFDTTLVAPLLWENQVLGVLQLFGHLAQHRFTGDSERLLTLYAQQAASALQNARLLEQEKRRTRQFALMYEIGRRLTAILDLNELFQEVVRAIQQAYGYTLVTINLIDGQMLYLAASTDPELQRRRQNRPLKVGEEGIVGFVAAHGEPVLANDVTQSPYYVPTLPDTQSELAVPVVGRSGIIGVLDLQDRRKNAFDYSDVVTLQALATQISVAIENARLFDAVRQHARQVTKLLEIMHHLHQQRDLNALFNLVCETVQQTLGWNTVALFLRDEERGLVRPVAVAAQDPAVREQILNLPPRPYGSEYWCREIYRISQSYFVPAERMPEDVPQDKKMLVFDLGERFEGEWQAADTLVVPIRLGDRILGHLSVDDPVSRKRPSLEQIQVLELFAHQVATAIADAQLIAELQAKTRELEEANVQLERASRMKSEFLANISHELRTPLNSIIGFSEVLQDQAFGPLNERQMRYINHVLTSARHLLDLINDILDLSKIEAGRMELHHEPFILKGAIEEVLTVVQPLAQQKQLSMSLVLDGAPDRLVADRLRFKQVLYNLVSNAIKFTPEGSVTVRACADDQYVYVSVEDTGIGIPPEAQEKVFDLFTRVEDRYRRATEGTGLGLALVKRLVELHGGFVTLESEVGKGTTVTVAFPIREMPPMTGATEPELQPHDRSSGL